MTESYHTVDISDDDRWDTRAAEVLAAAIHQAIHRRDRCLLALSGGSSPIQVFRLLGRKQIDWSKVVVLQVDERIVPLDSGERNLKFQRESLGASSAHWMPLPVDELLDLDIDPITVSPENHRVAMVLDRFVDQLVEVAGDPPRLDVVHLGLGVDGHTASLFPGDPLTGQVAAYVGLARPEDLTPRISLTRACLDRARMGAWLVPGSEKAPMLKRLVDCDPAIPAGLVRPAHSVILADRSAARLL